MLLNTESIARLCTLSRIIAVLRTALSARSRSTTSFFLSAALIARTATTISPIVPVTFAVASRLCSRTR